MKFEIYNDEMTNIQCGIIGVSETEIKINFKHCFHLLESFDQNVGFCLKFREWINGCPNKCQEFASGEVGKIAEAEQKKFNIECLHFIRQKNVKKLEIEYFCNLMEQEDPFCDSCQFPRYKEDI